MRPDAGVRAQISADTAIVDQSAMRHPSSGRVTVAECAVSGLSCPLVAKVAVHRGNPGQRLPLRVGRRDLRRLPLRRQHRESQSRFGIGHHSLRARGQATRRADRGGGVSNYERWLSGDDYNFINMI